MINKKNKKKMMIIYVFKLHMLCLMNMVCNLNILQEMIYMEILKVQIK